MRIAGEAFWNRNRAYTGPLFTFGTLHRLRRIIFSGNGPRYRDVLCKTPHTSYVKWREEKFNGERWKNTRVFIKYTIARIIAYNTTTRRLEFERFFLLSVLDVCTARLFGTHSRKRDSRLRPLQHASCSPHLLATTSQRITGSIRFEIFFFLMLKILRKIHWTRWEQYTIART